MKTRKTRPEAVWDNLPSAQQQQILEWAADGTATLADLCARARAEFSLSRGSVPSLSLWLSEKRLEAALEKIRLAGHTAKTVRAALPTEDESFSALMQMIGQTAFELKLSGETLDLDRLQQFADLAALGLKAKIEASKLKLSEADAQRDERRLVLLEKKAAQADETEKTLTDRELTPEQRAQRIKEIYGRA